MKTQNSDSQQIKPMSSTMESLLQKDFFVNILIFIIKRYPVLTELILDSKTVNDLIRISVLDTIPKNP